MRATLGWWCVALAGLAAVGCKKESGGSGGPGMGGEPIAAGSTDPLWAFAPADATVAVVVADGVLEPTYRGGLKVLAALDKAPGGAPVAAMIRQQARTPIGDVLDRATLDGLGVDLKKGTAFFESPSAKVVVLPVGDPARFAGKLGAPIENGVVKLGPMTCKTVSGRFLCGDSPAALDAAAKGGGGSLVAGWPRAMRGHIELFVAAARLDSDVPLGEPGGLRASAVLEPGAMTARLHLVGKPTGPLEAARSGKSTLTAGIGDKQPPGLLLINAAGLWKLAQAEAAGKTAQPLPGGVTSKDIVAALTGEAIGYALPGLPLRGLGKIGLSNPEPVKKLIAACAELAAALPPGLSLKKSGEKCTLTMDPAKLGGPVQGIASISIDAWVESNALVIGVGRYDAKSDVRPGLAPFAREILDGNWLMAAWGQGSLAGAPLMSEGAEMSKLMNDNPNIGLAMWGVYHLSEFGIAARVADDGIHGLVRVRTLWSNPDEVVTAVEEKIAVLIGGDKSALAAMTAIGSKFPGSPFGRDVQSGAGGLMAPVAIAGIVAAVSIPAFLKYQRRSQNVEALIHVRKLHSAARMYGLDHPSIQPGDPPARILPTQSAGPVPPLGTCCQQGGACQPDASWWSGEPWLGLHFSVDEPHRYSYEFRLDKGEKGFTVFAYGDLDCDGVYSTFSMHGAVDPTGTVTGDDDVTRVNQDE